MVLLVIVFAVLRFCMIRAEHTGTEFTQQATLGATAVEVTWSVPGSQKEASRAFRGLAELPQEQLPNKLPEDLEVSFKSNGTTFGLRLRRNRVLLPRHARHFLHYRNGTVKEGPMPTPCFYLGHVHGDASGHAAVSTCTGGISGLVLAHGRALMIEPLQHALPKGRRMAVGADAASGTSYHNLQQITDANFLDYQEDIAGFVAGPKKSTLVQPFQNSTRVFYDPLPSWTSKSKSHGRALSGSTGTKYVEVLVVNDNERYQAFGGQNGLEDLANQGTAVMNIVTTIYRTPPTDGAEFPYPVQVVLTGQHTFVDADPWENTVKVLSNSETDCSSLLDLFNNWATQQQLAGMIPESDNRVLLSSRDFDGSTVGLAGVSAMCEVSRSGNVNMCTQGDNIASCAAVVAHEMGHNLGMHHDSSGNSCPQSGLIMEAVGGGDASTVFSSCSTRYIGTFFNEVYPRNGECLENMPTRVFGDPDCGNGFVEDGEDCDCGGADCSNIDPCCDGSTCAFAQPDYECSASAGACCESCKFVAKNRQKTCRPARNECDITEFCPGGTADCPRDVFVYPGKACSVNGYDGLCSAGKCSSLSSTCSVDINRDFGDQYTSWGLTSKCAAFNDDCQVLVCHNSTHGNVDEECGQRFSTHGKQMTVPDGTPCWFMGQPLGQRSGMCKLGVCTLPHLLAEAPLCGNGGIDYGEKCDCGLTGGDHCCDCSTCQLKPGNQCSSLETCCDSNTCQFSTSVTVCRPAIGECDVAETCSGASGVCPSDVGKQWGTACTASDGFASNCYGKVCLKSLNDHCADWTEGEYPVADFKPDRSTSDDHECKATSCCKSCEPLDGRWNINGVSYDDPYFCNNCLRSWSTKTFTVTNAEGEQTSNTITLSAAPDGTMLNDGRICIDASEWQPDTQASCTSGQFLELSVGRCMSCDPACSACSGPTNFDCTGGCVHGDADSRGACPISAEQVAFLPPASTPTSAPPGAAAPTPAPTALTAAPTAQTPAPTAQTPAPTAQTPAPTAPTPAPTAPTPAPAAPTPAPITPAPPGSTPVRRRSAPTRRRSAPTRRRRTTPPRTIPPTPPPTTPSTIPPTDAMYQTTATNADVCANGWTLVDTSAECQSAARRLGRTYVRSNSWTNRPFGCIQRNGDLLFNTNVGGPAHDAVMLVCKKATYIRLSAEGATCQGEGYLDIATLADCEIAFDLLSHPGARGSTDHEVKERSYTFYPKGCFSTCFSDYFGYFCRTFNKHPIGNGRGVGSDDDVQLLCARENPAPTPSPLATTPTATPVAPAPTPAPESTLSESTLAPAPALTYPTSAPAPAPAPTPAPESTLSESTLAPEPALTYPTSAPAPAPAPASAPAPAPAPAPVEAFQSPTSAPVPAPAPTGVSVVILTLKVQNVNYADLVQAASILEEFLQKLREAIAQEAGVGILPIHVIVVLSAGSVMVESTITPPSNVDVTSVQNTLASSNSIASTVVSKVSAVDGISSVSTGSITVTNVSEPEAATTASAPTTCATTPFDCSAEAVNKVNKGSAVACNVVTCDASICCEAPATCATTPFNCSAQGVNKVNKGSGVACSGNAATCDANTCCVEGGVATIAQIRAAVASSAYVNSIWAFALNLVWMSW